MLKELLHNWQNIVALILGIYEVIARTVPTVQNVSIIHKLIKVLEFISAYLNVKKTE